MLFDLHCVTQPMNALRFIVTFHVHPNANTFLAVCSIFFVSGAFLNNTILAKTAAIAEICA